MITIQEMLSTTIGRDLADSTLPVTSRLSESSIKRLVEGIRIHRMHPDGKGTRPPRVTLRGARS